MIRLSKASPAIGTPSVPMMSDARRPRRAHAGPDRDDREVARAAAEVADQDPLVALQSRFVRVGGRDRLVLEDDLLEAGEPDRRQQAVGGERVELGVGRVREMDRPAEDDPPRRRPRRKARAVAHVLADERDQLLERVVLRADAGAFERPVREVGLQRLDEAALGLRREIALDRLAPRRPTASSARSTAPTETSAAARARSETARGGERRWRRRKRRRCWSCRNRRRPSSCSDMSRAIASHEITATETQRHRASRAHAADRQRVAQSAGDRRPTRAQRTNEREHKPFDRARRACVPAARSRTRCRRRRRATRVGSVSLCLRGSR